MSDQITLWQNWGGGGLGEKWPTKEISPANFYITVGLRGTFFLKKMNFKKKKTLFFKKLNDSVNHKSLFTI